MPCINCRKYMVSRSDNLERNFCSKECKKEWYQNLRKKKEEI